jgi:hypothetical protein
MWLKESITFDIFKITKKYLLITATTWSSLLMQNKKITKLHESFAQSIIKK